MADLTLTELEKLEAKLVQLSDSAGRSASIGVESELTQARDKFYELKRSGLGEVGSHTEKKLALLMKRCGYRLELLQAVKDREWQTKRVLLSRKLEGSAELARLLWEAITGQKPMAGWTEELSKPSFLCGVNGDNIDEVERMHRLLSFAVVFCAVGMERQKLSSNILPSSPAPIYRSAVAFASMEFFDRVDLLSDIARFPLNSIFPFSSRSGLEGDNFQTVDLLLRKAERADAEKKCQFASTAFQVGSDTTLDERSHLLSMIKAALLINRDINDLLPILRTFCHGKPDAWTQSALEILIKSITPEQRGKMLLTTKECAMVEKIKNSPSDVALFRARQAVMHGDFNQVCFFSTQSVAGAEIVKTELQKTLPAEVYGEAATRVPKLIRLACTGSKRTMNQDASRSEIIEHLIKQPKLSSLSSYGKSSASVSSKSLDGPLTAAALASKVKSHTTSNITLIKSKTVPSDTIKPNVNNTGTGGAPLTASSLKQKLFKVGGV